MGHIQVRVEMFPLRFRTSYFLGTCCLFRRPPKTKSKSNCLAHAVIAIAALSCLDDLLQMIAGNPSLPDSIGLPQAMTHIVGRKLVAYMI